MYLLKAYGKWEIVYFVGRKISTACQKLGSKIEGWHPKGPCIKIFIEIIH